jgi:hypothetical protein
MAGRKSWSELGKGQKAAIILAGTVELGLKAAALVDLYRRSGDEVRGPKAVWVAAQAVNFFGPVSYFAFGRRR